MQQELWPHLLLQAKTLTPETFCYRYFFQVLFFREDFLRGTLAPFARASDSPMAIACLRLFTFPPLPPRPERSVPFFRRRIALSTRLLADFPYFRPPLFFRPPRFFAAMCPLR